MLMTNPIKKKQLLQIDVCVPQATLKIMKIGNGTSPTRPPTPPDHREALYRDAVCFAASGRKSRE